MGRLTTAEDNFKAAQGDPEARIRNAAAREDTGRLSVDNPESRVPVDADPESRIKNAAAREDTGRLSVDNPESRVPVDADPETRIKNAAAREDTGRLTTADDNFKAAQGDPEARIRNAAAREDTGRLSRSIDNPESRVPVDADPESRIKNAAAREDTGRLTTADDNFKAAQGDPEARIRNAAASEDTGRLSRSIDNPESRVPVDGDPESRIKNAAAREDTGRLTTADDNFKAAQGDPEARIRNAAASEDTGRLSRSTDNPESRVPVDGDPESRIKNAAASQDKKRLSIADDNFKAAQGDPESRVRSAASAQDKLRSSTATDNFKAMNDTPEPKIKRVSGDMDTNRIRAATKDTFNFDKTVDSKLKSMVNKLDTKIAGKTNRLKNIFRRLATASTVTTDIVEGRVIGPDGRVKPLSDSPSSIKYDGKAAGAFGTSPTKECQSTPQGRSALARELSEAEIKARGTPRATMIKSAALKSARLAVDVIGTVGDVLDVLQIIQVFGNAAYYDPVCENDTTGAAGCKFPIEFLTANQAKDVSALAVKKQIEKLTNYTPRDPNFKPRFPLIRGPLDVLEPTDPYMTQTLLQLEVDAVQNKILNGDPWRSKYVAYFGSGTIVDEIVNDPSDALSYYTSKVGMTNAEIDSVYKQAFTSVCLYNGGKVWEDVYEGSGRPRFQCGFTKSACETARAKYFTPESAGNYVEWYTYTQLDTLLSGLTPPVSPIKFTSKPDDEDGICMVASAGTASLCNYYRGTYDVASHSCIFSKEYCQSIGTCHNSIDNTCYLPNNEMEALSFFFPGGGVREWIKVNGCTFRGTDADKAAYAVKSVMQTFMPITMLFTANDRKMLQDVIANSRNWGPGLRAQLKDPNTAVGFAGAVVGLSAAVAEASALAMGFASTGVGIPVAVAIIVAVGAVMLADYIETTADANFKAKVDKEDTALHGLQKVGETYIPVSTGVSEGWVTRKLVTTKKSDNTLCTAIEYYKNPTTCTPVVWTAENPHVVEIPFVSTKEDTRITQLATSGASAFSGLAGSSGGYASYAVQQSAMQAGYLPNYDHKLQCWKKEYTQESNDGSTKTGVTGALVGAAVNYGDANGTPDAATGKIFDGYIRAGTDGSKNKTWCLERKPRTSLFDATIGTPAPETQNLRNRFWTSKLGDVDPYFPEYPTEASYLSAATNDHFRYQLVYAKDSIPVTTMWDDGLMSAVFTETTVTEIRRYYCEQELVKKSSDVSSIDKRCLGYIALDISGYTWFPMSVAGKVQSVFNTKTGTVTTGRLVPGNKDDWCTTNYGQNWEEESKGLCYLNCNYGGGATNDTYAYVSREWKSDGTIQCLKQYPKWEKQSKNLHGELTIVKDIRVAEYQGTPSSCPSDKEQGGGLCYPKCSSKFTLAADEEAISNGATECYKHYLWWENEASRKGRPAGTGPRTSSTMNKPLAFSALRKGLKSSGVCPDNYTNEAGVCLKNCGPNQKTVGVTCYDKICPDGYIERTGGLCYRQCKNDPGCGTDPKKCHIDTADKRKYVWDQSACYKQCDDGWSRSSLGFCMENCTSRTIRSEHNSSDTRTNGYGNNGAGVCVASSNFQCPGSYDRWGVGTTTPTCFRPYKQQTKTSQYTVIGQACAKVCRCAQYGSDFTSTGTTCYRAATYRVIGQACAKVCRCDQHGPDFNSTGTTCYRSEKWSTGCSSYLCC
jgi:ribosomal protein L19E